MKKLTIIVHKNYVEDIIKKLHETGMVEIIDIAKEEPAMLEETQKAAMHPEAASCTTYELRLTRLIGILKRTQKRPGGVKGMFNPVVPEKRPIDQRSLDELYSYTEGILNEIEQDILSYEEQLQQIDEQKEKLQSSIDQVSYLKPFHLAIEDLGESPYLTLKAGKTTDLALLEEKLKEIDHAALFSHQFGTGKKKEWAVVLVAHISEQESIEKLSREHLILFDFSDLSGSPTNAFQALMKQKATVVEKKKQIRSELRTYAEEHLKDLQVLREEIQLERVRKEVPQRFTETDSSVVIKGWVLEKNETAIQSLLNKVSDECILVDSELPSANPDAPPTFYKTPKWASGFRMLLEMFATPKYNEINPTIVMGFFFVLFFGVMLGDAGYGLVILILSLFIYFKFGKASGMLRMFSFMGIWMGLVTTVFGILTYSIFGDLVPRFMFGDPTIRLYEFNLLGIQFPVESLSEPLAILTMALVFGLIHLNIGVILGIYQAFKQRRYKEMVTHRICWILLQLGGGLLIGRFILGWSYATPLFYAAGVMVLVGIILLLGSAGPVGFFDITGYVGDWLSYARLLALGLATAGMALAFNVVSQLLGEMIPVIGGVIMVILLIILHIVNLALQALGAAVHSLRLQYVEFFNRFYEGGGRPFRPFKMRRKFTRLKEG